MLGGERFDAMSCWPSSAKLFYGGCKLISIKCKIRDLADMYEYSTRSAIIYVTVANWDLC